MSLDNRGQAFDVFKLLIAAVVALAMLAILLPLLNIDFGLSDPPKEAVNLVKNNEGRPGSYGQTAKSVIFKSGTEITSKAVAAESNVGLTSSQICFSYGDFDTSASSANSGAADFKIEPGGESKNARLTYSGSQLKAKIGIICDDGASIEGDLQERALPATVYCGGDTTPSGSQTFCVLILKAA